MVMMLAARVISCHRCLPRFLPAINEQQERARSGQDAQCDFCLMDDEWFRPVTMQIGAIVTMGDMCSACCDRWGLPGE
jgi:hypothetical protein